MIHTGSPLYEHTPVFSFTADVDWASEEAIDMQQDIFDRHAVHATYFMTHQSPRLTQLEAEGCVDLAAHPNFLPGSSHGNSFAEVIETVLRFAPRARCYRGHKYFDVSDVAHAFRARGFCYDANLCTNLQPGIAPILHESGLIRFATFFEDGTHYWNRQSWRFSDVADAFAQPGLKIISVHPMVTAMNVPTPEYWAEIRRMFPGSEMLRVSKETLLRCRRPEPGPLAFLEDLLAWVRKQGFPVMTLEDLYQNFGVAQIPMAHVSGLRNLHPASILNKSEQVL